MKQGTTYVGLDVHKATIAVAMLLPEREVPEQWEVANEPRALKRLIRKLKREAPGAVRCCYEAGPCGYGLQRQLLGADIDCQVVAPALIPRKPGDRIKTDRRDARKLAEYLRAGLLTEVAPPTLAEESLRDLVRCRGDILDDLQRARQRLGKFLLRRNLRYWGKSWTKAHRKWLKEIEWEHEEAKLTFEHYLSTLERCEEQLNTADKQIAEVAETEPYKEPVGRLRCFRGIDTTTAMTIVSELHGFLRFPDPRSLMAYLGLVPGEHSTGDDKRRGAITKAGNEHVRRVLVESSWHCRHRPNVGVKLRKRREGQSQLVVATADKAMLRLHKRYRHLVFSRSKPANKAVTAVAREFAGFIWAVLIETEWAQSGGVA